MIKIDKENFKIETDCKTVGEFMTEAAAFGLSVKVTINDNDNYFFEGGQKVKVVDDTPIDKVLFDLTDYTLNARASFRVFTKQKPKTVRNSGWVNIYRAGFDNYKTTPDNRRPAPQVYNSKEAAEQAVRLLSDQEEQQRFIATARIEWEEVVK